MTRWPRGGPILWVLLAGACPSSEVPRESGPDPDRSGLEARADRPRPPDLAGDLAPSDVKPCDDPGVVVAPGVTVRPTQLAPGGQATIVYQASTTRSTGC